jgi:O-antigen ligase
MTSRYYPNLPYFLIMASVCSFVSIFLLQIFIGLLGIMWLFEKNSEKRKAFDLLSWVIIVFGTVRLIAIIFSEYRSISIEALSKEVLFYFSFFSLNYYLRMLTEEKRLNLIGGFVAAGILVSLSGILLFNFRKVYRAESFSAGSMVFSFYLLAILPVLIFHRRYPENKKHYYIWLAGLIIILTGIITAQGRTSILIAFIIILTGIILKKINIKSFVLISLFVFICSVISFYNNPYLFSKRIEDPVYLSNRDVLFKGAGLIFYNHPFLGNGPRTFRVIFPIDNELKKEDAGWHDDFLQVYFESGILGVAAFLTLIFVVYYSGMKIYRNCRKRSDLLLGLLFSEICFFLSALTSGFITSVYLSIIFAFIISIVNSFKSYS